MDADAMDANVMAADQAVMAVDQADMAVDQPGMVVDPPYGRDQPADQPVDQPDLPKLVPLDQPVLDLAKFRVRLGIRVALTNEDFKSDSEMVIALATKLVPEERCKVNL